MKKNTYDKKIKALIKNCQSKDETRPQLNAICHVSALKALCATDGHRALILYSHYNEELKDLVICQNTMTIIKRDYPRISPLIPDSNKLDSTLLKLEKKFLVKSKMPTKLFFYSDRISFEQNDDYLFCLNTNLMNELFDDQEYRIFYKDKLSPVIFKLNKYNDDILLVMPMKA